MLSVWKCIFCNKENDHTNPTRCWNCNKKKSKPNTVKKIISKRKQATEYVREQQRQQVIEKIDNILPKKEEPLVEDLSKLIINP
jgi:hypothetical protein